jgi:hypothetical protein
MFVNCPAWLTAKAERPMFPMMLALALLAPMAGTLGRSAVAAEDRPDLDGIWKLVAHSEGDAEWAIMEIKQAGGKFQVELIDAPKVFGKAQIYLATSPDALVVLLALEQGDITFKGRLHPADAGSRIAGALQFRAMAASSTTGAWMEKTTARKVAEPRDSPEKSGAIGAVRLLVEMRKATAEYQDDRYKALEATTSARAAAGLPIDAPTSARAWALSRLVDAAKRAGKTDAAAEQELARIKELITEEGRPPTVPLVVAPGADRRDSEGNQVVLVELFTGAQCGPCVAADVAFDALSIAYKTSDMIALQYHLHIPGPDPLTSPDSVSRRDYYAVRSTPSTFFNGRALAGSGGPVEHSRRKFNQYRHVIDQLRKEKRIATINLGARRTGDEIHITASAKIGESAGTPPLTPRLRLALVEESVAYKGRNGLPTHHHVVRAMPGGAEGRNLAGGDVVVEETVRISELRRTQKEYLKNYPASPGSRGPFPGAPPPLDLKKLNVVAFIQDDSDHSVLDAVAVPVD